MLSVIQVNPQSAAKFLSYSSFLGDAIARPPHSLKNHSVRMGRDLE